ncbi:MAG TPA: helix-turn-helix transcriptional regulator [Pyrinomonadaceae bacterium]|jgi:transcriptional regulator with XRE-family HTH domain|nr:helix-turn-helix transcriptional regulator [Pyrinomonadaceae bacterium]
MGEKARPKPKRLAEKLLQIRVSLGLSQNGLIRQLGVDLTQNRISDYELGIGEPSLPVILRYARLAGLSTDFLIDDDLNLPAKLPAKSKRS